MAYTEKHLDRSGAKALAEALGRTNAEMVKKKSSGAKKKSASGNQKSGGK